MKKFKGIKKLNKVVSLVVVLMIIISILPVQIFAESGVIGKPNPPNPGKPNNPSLPNPNPKPNPNKDGTGVSVNSNKTPLVSTSGGTSVSTSGDVGSVSVNTDIDIDILLKINANTIIMDLAKFNLIGLPYELEPMKEFLKDMPEYKFGDIIDFKNIPYTMQGRSYYEYEQALVRDGIIRHPSDVTYNLNLSKGEFTWEREHTLKMKTDDEITATYFLASLARQAGNRDNIYISTRSTATWVLNTNLTETRFKGRQKIEESPYQKEVQGQVDIGTSIVLVDYDDREYLVVRLDNIYKPYISYLVDIGVINPSDIECTTGYNYVKQNANTGFGMYRVNYNSIPVSKVSDLDSKADLPYNEDSTKKFDWESEQVTLKKFSSSEGDRNQYPPYNLEEICGNEPHYEYLIDGSMGSSYMKLKAQIPKVLKEENISLMEALTYIYKYMRFQETETILNDLEVDAITSLYGLKFNNYNDDEIKVLKYLIAKGIVNPNEDNLELMRRPLLYKDILKYLYRLNYVEKRFDFKNLVLSSDDIRMASMGYMQDVIKFNSNGNSIDSDLERAKEDLRQQYLKNDEALGYEEIYVEIPSEEYKNNNFILSSSKDLSVKFETTPMTINGKVYGMAFIPKTFSENLVLRSTNIEGGYRIPLSSWENGGIYVINSDGSGFTYSNNMYYSFANPIVNLNRFASTSFVTSINPDKEYSYKQTPLFVGNKGSRTINPELTKIFEYKDGKLRVLGVSSFEEIDAILNDVEAPPQLSSDEMTFIGYSQLTINGRKTTLIRDLELNKFGIEIVEDNLLYNRELDAYAYLDLRNSIMYYGNTIMKFEPGTLMVEGLSGSDTTFYNFEVVKSLLTKVVSNKSIANEILVQLPPDEQVLIKEKDGKLYDNVFMHPNRGMREGDWWLNVSTLSKKNSNIIFFRDTVKDINMLINYRARVKPVQDGIKTDNSVETLINALKFGGLEIHDSVNPLLQSIIGYDGKFSVYDYNYGIALLYPEFRNIVIRGNIITEGTSVETYKNSETTKALYRVLDLFRTKDEVDAFISTFHPSSLQGFGYVTLPEGYGVTNISDDGDITVKESVTLEQYFNSVKNKAKAGLENTVYLSTERFISAEEEGYEQESSVPVKIWNNNLYFRFNNFDKFSDIKVPGPYRFLDALIFLYQFNRSDKTLTIKHEKVNYDNTSAGYIPLEAWNKANPIDKFSYLGKIALRTDSNTIGNKSETPYLFDRVAPTKYKVNDGVILIDIPEGAAYTNAETLQKVYELLLNSNAEFKTALESSAVSQYLNTNNMDFLKKFLSKSLEGSQAIDYDVDDTGESQKFNFVEFVKGGFAAVGKLINNVKDFISKVERVKEVDINDKNFVFKAGKTYSIKPIYLFPAGTSLVNVGEDYYGELKNKNNSYKIEVIPNKIPRVVLGNSFDLLNQNLAQLNDENLSIKDIPSGSRVILGSGLELVALKNQEFIVDRGKAFGKELDSEEVLLWTYLEDMNVRVGTSLNFLNGVESIRLPKRADLVGEFSTTFLETVIKDKKIAFTNESLISSGRLSEEGITEEETEAIADAYIYPIIRLNEAVIVTKIMQNKDLQDVYLVRSLGTSVEQDFLQYLRDGVVDVNAPLLQNPDIDLSSIQTEGSEINAFRMKNILIGLSKVFQTLKIGIPLVLFGYGITVMVFLILFSVEMVRRFLENIIPDDYLLAVYKFLSLFSVDEMFEMDRVTGFIRAFILIAVSIVWWIIVRR